MLIHDRKDVHVRHQRSIRGPLVKPIYNMVMVISISISVTISSISVIISVIVSAIISTIVRVIIIIPIIVITAPNDMFADREVSVVGWSNPLSPSTQSQLVAPTCRLRCSQHM